MNAHQLAGKPAPRELLANIPRLVSMYYAIQPDPDDAGQLVAFGTSGHRGSSVDGTFNEEHILAISQAICEYRRTLGADGRSWAWTPTRRRAGIEYGHRGLTVQRRRRAYAGRLTPTPVISHAILTYNRGRTSGLADGVVSPVAQPAAGWRPLSTTRRRAPAPPPPPRPSRIGPMPCCAGPKGVQRMPLRPCRGDARSIC